MWTNAMDHRRLSFLMVFQLCCFYCIVICCPSENAAAFKGDCYIFHTEMLTKAEAVNKCGDAGGALVVLAEHEEMNFLLSEFRRGATENETIYWIEQKKSAHSHNNDQIEKIEPFPCTVINALGIFDHDCKSVAGYICKHSRGHKSSHRNCPQGSFISVDGETCFWMISFPLSMFGKQGELGAYEACALSNGSLINSLDLFGVQKQNVLVASLAEVVSGHVIWVDTISGSEDYSNTLELNGDWTSKNSSLSMPVCHIIDFNMENYAIQTKNCSFLAYAVCQSNKKDIISPLVLPSMNKTRHKRTKRFLFKECPHGYNWKEDTSTGYCYWETSYETNRLPWADARRYCQSYGGDLASFHSRGEEMIGLSFQYGSLIHPYWIGLIYQPENDLYVWTDGTPVNYTNWAPGQPDHRFGRMRCVQMHASEKHWVVSYCGVLSWFVCKAPKQFNPKPPELPKQEPLTKCMPDSTGYFFDGYCYELPRVPYSWIRANTYCRNTGSHLVSVHTEAELDFLIRLLYEFRADTNKVWTGLHATSMESPFQWSDGTVLDFVNWDLNEPSKYYNPVRCGNMYVSNGLWSDDDCSHPFHFICKWKNSTDEEEKHQVTPSPVVGNCRQGWVGFGKSCYFAIGTKQTEWETFENASKACQQLGGQLASVSSEKEQEVLAFLLQYIQSNSWIGLHSGSFESFQMWTDGSFVDYTNWAPSQPESVPADWQVCVEMIYKSTESGQWKVEHCNKSQAFICESFKDPELSAPPDLPKFMKCIHPPDWIKMGPSCFKVFTNKLSWYDALEKCRNNHAELVSVSDSAVWAVTKYLALDFGSSFWIGLVMNADREFHWINNQSMTFSGWGYHQPNLTVPEPICFSSSSNGYWNATQCSEKLPFICQVTGGPALPTSPTEFDVSCPQDYFDGGGDYCYYFEPTIRTDWYSASFKCFSRGDSLASFHTAKEIENLQKKVSSSGANEQIFSRSYYIGLVKDIEGGLAWSDESPVDFVNWIGNKSQLSYSVGCTIIVGTEMKWDMTPCTSKTFFVCGKAKASLVISDFNATKEYVQAPKDLQAGLSSGALAAIIVLLLVSLAIGAVLVFVYIRAGNRFPFRIFSSPPERVMSFENALFNPDAGMELCHKRLETDVDE